MLRDVATKQAAHTLPDDLFGKVVLVTGKEEFLRARVLTTARVWAKKQELDDITALTADQLDVGAFEELTAPSLFSAQRCGLVSRLEDLPDEATTALLDYVASPAEDVALVLEHSGGQKGSGVLTKLRKAGVVDVKVPDFKPSELPDFVRAEFRSQGRTIEPEAAEALVDAVGGNLRDLAAAAAQLATDVPEGSVRTDSVRLYFGGRAEAKSFAVADAAFAGRRELALGELRWMLSAGGAGVLVTSAFAGTARGIARFMGAPRGMRDNDLARELGVPFWKVRSIRSQARSWSEAGIAQAIRAIAAADADIKGAGDDPEFTLERLVLTIAALRTG